MFCPCKHSITAAGLTARENTWSRWFERARECEAQTRAACLLTFPGAAAVLESEHSAREAGDAAAAAPSPPGGRWVDGSLDVFWLCIQGFLLQNRTDTQPVGWGWREQRATWSWMVMAVLFLLLSPLSLSLCFSLSLCSSRLQQPPTSPPLPVRFHTHTTSLFC